MICKERGYCIFRWKSGDDDAFCLDCGAKHVVPLFAQLLPLPAKASAYDWADPVSSSGRAGEQGMTRRTLFSLFTAALAGAKRVFAKTPLNQWLCHPHNAFDVAGEPFTSQLLNEPIIARGGAESQ